MQWKAKYTKPDYQHGTTRLKRCFAFLPIYINGNMIWLETYEILQIFKIEQLTAIIDSKETIFANGSWKNLSKRCK